MSVEHSENDLLYTSVLTLQESAVSLVIYFLFYKFKIKYLCRTFSY